LDDHTSKTADGGITDCTPYACSTSGLCGQNCIAARDCTGSNVCDTTFHCAAPSGSSGDSGGCAVAHPPRARGGLGALLVMLAWVLRRVRRWDSEDPRDGHTVVDSAGDKTPCDP